MCFQVLKIILYFENKNKNCFYKQFSNKPKIIYIYIYPSKNLEKGN